MVVGDDQPHPRQSSGAQRAQERGPKTPVLTVTNLDAEHFTVSGGGDAGGNHHRPRQDPALDSRL